MRISDSGSKHAGYPRILPILGSGLTTLWLSRAYSVSATSTSIAWADAGYYRNLKLLYWGAVLSVCALILIIGMGAVRSKRFRLAFLGSVRLWSLLLFVSKWGGLRVAAVPLMPGIIIEMMAFGVHSGPLSWVGGSLDARNQHCPIRKHNRCVFPSFYSGTKSSRQG
jgi:hypothetical protein